ncbi:Peptidyl-prolyl cis-trans isomerase CYP28, chloroplastic [Ananas comosus]|uniref:Peptidyl-prolyl cis-trans isomerase CYP28, chloroplastic n=1 Tax=Ananas comosus TaxID=4615 RepID=A0A199W9I0_ANACO|nr:Peptidyl-prolyl cis-trans isomerase CYP28, chloroplastic [Ananas comosus]
MRGIARSIRSLGDAAPAAAEAGDEVAAPERPPRPWAGAGEETLVFGREKKARTPAVSIPQPGGSRARRRRRGGGRGERGRGGQRRGGRGRGVGGGSSDGEALPRRWRPRAELCHEARGAPRHARGRCTRRPAGVGVERRRGGGLVGRARGYSRHHVVIQWPPHCLPISVTIVTTTPPLSPDRKTLTPTLGHSSPRVAPSSSSSPRPPPPPPSSLPSNASDSTASPSPSPSVSTSATSPASPTASSWTSACALATSARPPLAPTSPRAPTPSPSAASSSASTPPPPLTAANFKAACAAAAYRGTLVHKVLPGQFFVAGRQGRREKGEVRPPPGLARNVETVDPKAFQLRHSRPGTLSLCLSENDDDDEVKLDPDYHNVEFLVTTGPGPCPQLDGENIVFGTVLEGLDVVTAIASIPTYKPAERIRLLNDFAEFIGDERAQVARTMWNRPLKTVYISDCGELKVTKPSLSPSLP